MMRLRIICGALIMTLTLSSVLVRAQDPDLGPAEKLVKAIKLYDSGEYRASRQVLRSIDEDELTSEEQSIQWQRYLSLTAQAIAGRAEAKEDFASGTSSFSANDLDKAKRFFARVVDNRFAPSDLKAKANSRLREIEAKQKAAAQAAGTQPAGGATSRAVGRSRLVDSLAKEHELLWQKAVSTYREAESRIRKAVLEEDFPEAHRLMDFAKETIELNRRYASPVTRYEDYRDQALDLETFIADEERAYEERLIIQKRQEIEERERQRIRRDRETKRRQIALLMNQATELRRENRYDEAIQVIKQVLAIDPENNTASLMKEALEDFSVNLRNIRANREQHRQSQDLLVETEESTIPWHQDMLYPKNWPEIAAKREGVQEARELPIDREVRHKLDQIAPEITFDAQPFEEVVEYLRTVTELNIVPNWTALEDSAIEKDAEVTLKLKNVKYEKALELILDEVGGGDVDLAYEIDDGVIQISTKDDLARKYYPVVYDVTDLTVEIVRFPAIMPDITQVGQQQQQSGSAQALSGGGTGGGTGGQGAGQGLFQGGGGGGTDQAIRPEEDPMDAIVELIQNTIDPESWVDAGGTVGRIDKLNTQLIITQTATAHDEIRNLLRELRQARALQIAVEARFITISRNWLEQIGVDLDIVLNNGNAGFDRAMLTSGTPMLDPATGAVVLAPRQFSRLGFTPAVPGVGNPLPQQRFLQPFGQAGLVPGTGSVGPASGTMSPIPITNNTLELATPIATNVEGSLGGSTTLPALQVFGSFLDNIQVDFLLRATQVDRRASDLEAPRLVLLNGQEAAFQAITAQTYVASLQPIIGDNAGQFLPTPGQALSGRSLSVRAWVSADRKYVTLEIQTFTVAQGEMRSVFFAGSRTVGSGFIELPTTRINIIQTTVSVPDGGTLLIGGLKQSGEREVDAGVPILSRIPILKRAFSNTSTVKDDRILLILIKPKIIIQEEAEAEAFPTLSSASP